MANLNKVFLIGNLTRDPELRYTPGGTAVANLGIAVNRRFKDSSGELKEEVCFLTVTVWDKQATACCQYLTKGRPVFVEGVLQSRFWETSDGQKRSAIDVRAERVQFLGSSGGNKEKVEAPQEATAGVGVESGEAIKPEDIAWDE
ncbi:Single-stranded DNA-binding protein [hydrothermal vent metagenome]|uniref:Single-stranded DNA-binding protein n=1 Tax=hydrothermal vent metagenome TaxID=652676 RepID=A0A3B1DDE6_9ZZZZ